MKLKKIIDNLSAIKKIEGKTSLEVNGLTCDSKAVKDGYIFVAVKGSKLDGADFINEAIDRGAEAVMLEYSSKFALNVRRGITFIYVNDIKRSLFELAKAFYGDISGDMHLIGVTGTNGKTTITYLIESLFKIKSEKSGVIGTVNYRFGKRAIPAVNTTPGILDLYSLLASMKKEGIKNCVLEASSHSLEQGRVDGLDFDAAIFTNLTTEHLDYHKDMDNYLAAKMKLFDKIKKGGYAVINADDPSSKKIIEKVKAEKNAKVITYGIEKKADVYAANIELSPEGSRFRLNNSIDIRSHLIGRHNIYNILASASCGIAMAMSMEDIKCGIESLVGLPGRLEKIDCGQDFTVFVDYAHTDNGMENVLIALKELNPKRLITVFGCGGDRDKTKRPKMGRISSELSDMVFITSDNPRSEDPRAIANQIVEGITKAKNNYVVEVDRFVAIKKALMEAKKGDIVVVAGKGHETYQVFKDITFPFDDRETVKKILMDRRYLCSQSKIS